MYGSSPSLRVPGVFLTSGVTAAVSVLDGAHEPVAKVKLLQVPREQSERLELAFWLTSPKHPLTAPVGNGSHPWHAK